MFRIKRKSDGSIQHYKGELVILGNTQAEGLDYGETFAPVAKMVTILTLLFVASACKWEIHQMDIHNAFLYGDSKEDVYMRLPPRFSKGKEEKVCHLKKSLYGLKQASCCWFAKLISALKYCEFRQSYYDYSLFTYYVGHVFSVY